MTPETIEYHRSTFRVTRCILRLLSRVFAAGLLLALLLAVLLLPGSAHAGTPEWLLFLGRFHPLVLHLPIGLLVLLPLLHMLARVVPAGTLRPVIALTLWLCAASAFSAAICGLMLAQENGYSGETLLLHRRLALVLTVLSVLLMVCESESENPSLSRMRLTRWARRSYRALLPLTLLCLGLAAHLGANLTHGSTFLTEHLPPAIKARLAGAPASRAFNAGPQQGESAYATLVAPILDARCTSCHGSEKSKGGLRLQTLAAILAGGKSQREDNRPLVVPGHADQSLLIGSVCLPLDDDAHMPPSGKPQLNAAEIATLRWWIDAGADEKVPASQAPATGLVGENRPGIPRI